MYVCNICSLAYFLFCFVQKDWCLAHGFGRGRYDNRILTIKTIRYRYKASKHRRIELDPRWQDSVYVYPGFSSDFVQLVHPQTLVLMSPQVVFYQVDTRSTPIQFWKWIQQIRQIFSSIIKNLLSSLQIVPIFEIIFRL